MTQAHVQCNTDWGSNRNQYFANFSNFSRRIAPYAGRWMIITKVSIALIKRKSTSFRVVTL